MKPSFPRFRWLTTSAPAFSPRARTILELRFDNANEPIFVGRNGDKKNQTSLTIGQVFSF